MCVLEVVDDARGVEVCDVRVHEACERPFEGTEVAGCFERELVGAVLRATGERREPHEHNRRGEHHYEHRERDAPGVGRLVPEHRPEQRDERDRRKHEDPRELRHVAVLSVGELVREHRAYLRGLHLLEQGVVQDDPPGCAEARDVRVRLRRAPARVGDEHVADGDANPLGQAAEVGGQLLVLERLELVEDRFEHDRRDEREEDDERRSERCGDERPCVGPMRKRDEPEQKCRREERGDREPLCDIGQPASERLGREPPAMLAHVVAPVRDREPHEREQPEHDRGIHERLRPPAPVREQRVTEAGEGEQGEHADTKCEVGQLGQVAGPVVAPAPLDLLAGKRHPRIVALQPAVRTWVSRVAVTP